MPNKNKIDPTWTELKLFHHQVPKKNRKKTHHPSNSMCKMRQRQDILVVLFFGRIPCYDMSRWHSSSAHSVNKWLRWVAPFFLGHKKKTSGNRGYFSCLHLFETFVQGISGLSRSNPATELGALKFGSSKFWIYPRPRPWSYRSSLFIENIYQCLLPLGCQLTNRVTYAMSIHVLQRWLVWYLGGKINSLRKSTFKRKETDLTSSRSKEKIYKNHQLKNYPGVPVTWNNLRTVGTSFELFVKFQWLRNHNETDNPQEPTRKVLYLKDPSTPWSGCPKPLPGHSCLCTFNDPRRPWSKNTANLLQKTQQVQHLSINW